MKIGSFAVNAAGSTRAVTQKQVDTSKPAETNHDADSVEIRSGRGAAGAGETVYTVAPESDARIDRVEQVRRKLEQGPYEGDILRDVTERLLQSPGMSDIVTELSVDTGSSAVVRMDRVDDVRERYTGDYYNQQDVIRSVAGRMIDTLRFKE